MAKLDELLDTIKMNELMKKKEDKKNTCLIWVLAVVGAVAVIAAIAYAVYRYLTPDYLEDFDDDFDDDFEDDDFEDEVSDADKADEGQQAAAEDKDGE